MRSKRKCATAGPLLITPSSKSTRITSTWMTPRRGARSSPELLITSAAVLGGKWEGENMAPSSRPGGSEEIQRLARALRLLDLGEQSRHDCGYPCCGPYLPCSIGKWYVGQGIEGVHLKASLTTAATVPARLEQEILNFRVRYEA